MSFLRPGFKYPKVFTYLFALGTGLSSVANAQGPQTVVLQEFESGAAGAVAVTTANSPTASNSNSVVITASDNASNRLKITDADGGANGAKLTIPGGIPAPGYYLFTADVKVDNSAAAPIASYGMAVTPGAGTTTEISDLNAGYVLNLTGSGDASLGYQTIGASINVPTGGSFPQDVTIYFGTDVSANSYNAPASDGDFTNAHRSNAAAWAAGSANAVYVDNIKRIGPGNMGEERHLWISVGDAFTNLASLENYLVQAKANNFTAVDILARYRADAYYVPNRNDASYANPEPFGSRIGTITVSPSNDPLQYAIDRCRELNLKVYISFSSFLVTPNSIYPTTLPSGSVMGYQPTTGEPRDMVSADNSNEGLWADPGRQDVRDYTKRILMDIVTNYDIDGVIFDRVRYPGSRFGYNPVALSEMGYASAPSPFSSAFRDSRRNVLGQWLAECYNEITTAKPWVVVGATPVAFGTALTDTYNNVFQHWPTWTKQKVSNRTVSFGAIDLFQPQFYRLASAAAPNNAPGANTILMNKALFGDVATDSLDQGLMPGTYSMVAPTFYHPSSGDTAQSNANAQNVTDGRALGVNGFGFFAANTTLNDINLIRNPGASSAGADVMAGTPTKVDYLFKSGYDNVAPNAVSSFHASPQTRGSVVFDWTAPAAASDGDTADRYLIYKSTTQPVREIYANQVTKLPVRGNWFHAPVADAGNFYYKIVPLDDYNNRGASTEIGPFTVSGAPTAPADIIVDDEQATIVGAWTRGTSATDKYSVSYRNRGVGTGANRLVFTANIPVAGTYAISEWHPQGTNRPSDAHHIVQHAGGTANVAVDQKVNGGKWNVIGTYTLNAGSNSVTIDDVFAAFTGGVVMADAIKWSYVVIPTVPPAAPSSLLATPTSSNAISLTWQDNASNELGYELERTIAGGSTVIISLPPDTTSYSDASLAADTEYKYIIRAWNAGAQSPDSNMAAARTFPHVPDDIIIDNPQARLTGTWTVASASGQYGSNYLQGFASLVRAAAFEFVPERTAVYEIYEWHIAGTNRTYAAPHNVLYSGGAQQLVPVNQQINGSGWNKIGEWIFDGSTTQSVTITNAFPAGSGTVVMADAIKVVYKAEPPTTPAAPSGLSGIALSHEEIALSWADNAVNETSYIIERTQGSGPAQVVASVAANTISYIDTGLSPLTAYTYVVRAVNSEGQSGNSNAVTVTTLSSTPPDQIIDNLQADLVGTWSLSAGSAERWGTNYAFRSKSAVETNTATFRFGTRDTGLYEVFEWHPSGTNRAVDARHYLTHANGTDLIIVDQRTNGGAWNSIGTYAFNGGTTYSVKLSDVFTQGDVLMADAIKVVWIDELPSNPPAAPSGLTATAHGATQVDLSWADNTSHEQGFQIYRNGTLLTTVGANVTVYADTAATECTPYTYTVRAVEYGIPSADSNAASVSLDATAPVISEPAPVVVSTDAGLATASNVDLGAVSASDNCDSNPTLTNNAPASYALGVTIVTWTATDAKGNSAVTTQTVTVNDTEAPAITAPAAVSVSTDAGLATASGVALGSAVVTDNADANPIITNNAPAVFSFGVTTVTWTATDASGNSATATQQVTVKDTEAPALTAPASISVNTDLNAAVATNVNIGTATATDNVTSTVTITNDAPATFPLGITTITWTATDGSGNTATATQTVTVTDNQAPVIIAPAAIARNTNPGQPTAFGFSLGTATATDNADPAAVISNDAPAAFPVGVTIVTWTATDASGNTASATQQITVADVEKPTITPPANIVVPADPAFCNGATVSLGTPVVADNTGVASVVNNAPSVFPMGTTTVTWTVTDLYGNTKTATQTVKVVNNPVATPTLVSANPIAWDEIKVTWASSTNATQFKVYYAPFLLGPYYSAGTVSGSATELTVTGLQPLKKYYFIVQAINSCSSSNSSTVNATTLPYTCTINDPTYASSQWSTVTNSNAIGGTFRSRARISILDPAEWSTTVPDFGVYKISVYIPNVSANGLSTQATYTISNGILPGFEILNQKKYAGSWVELQTTYLLPGNLTIAVGQSNNSSNAIAADAIKIEQVN